MRPFQIVVISIFALLAVVGLVVFATFRGFGGGKPLGAVTIWGTLPVSAVQVSLDDIKRSKQEFSKVVYVERSAATFDADLSDAIASGAGPDLILITQEQLLANKAKISVIPFSTIPERKFRDLYVPAGESFLASNGTYAVPYVVDPLVLYYNRTLLSSAGLVQAPVSWEAVVGSAPTLTIKSGSSISRSTIPLGTYENIGNARAIISLLLLQSGSAVTAETPKGFVSTLGQSQANTSGNSASESALAFYTQFADPAKVVYSWNRSFSSARQAFIAGDAALYIGYASELPMLKAANPNLDFDMAQVPQPQTAASPADYGLVYAFAIPKASKNPTGAYRSIVALSSASALSLTSTALGMAPAQRSLLAGRTNDLYAPVYYPLALIMKVWLSPPPRITDRIFADMINNIISGRMSVHDAIQDADQSLNAALP